MTSERLREAAALMRERAEAAVAYTDAKTGVPLAWVNGLSGEVFDLGAAQIAVAIDHGTSRHIASWHPAVALAVADWLDQTARLHEFGSSGPLDMPAALAVADAYLGPP